MRGVLFGVIAVMGAGLLVPQEATAQDRDWWEWALVEVLESRYESDRYARDRYDRSRSDTRLPGDVIDIILGRRDGRVYDPVRRDRDRWDEDWDDRGDRRAGKGPPFCRNGRGHPVHGRSWCREKGWSSDYGRGPVVWDRRGGLGDIILRNRSRYGGAGVIDRGGLVDILGDVVLGRLIRDARLDRNDRLRGRWLTPYGRASVLQLRSGSRPVAELTDGDGDGRVDVVLMPRR